MCTEPEIRQALSDGSKINKRLIGRIYLVRNSQTRQNLFYVRTHGMVLQAEVIAFFLVAKVLCPDEIQDQNIIALVDSKAAIEAFLHSTVEAGTVQQYIKNLNRLDESYHIIIAWTPGHTGIYGNKMTDNLANSESTVISQSPEPFIPVSHASCSSDTKKLCR